MSQKWSREQIEKLILCVEQNPCIYHIKSLEYLDRVKKSQAFNCIMEELKKYNENITIDEIKRKWRVLRTQYMQEVRTIEQSKKSGAGITDVYVPKLWCFQQMHFLKIHTQNRQSKDNTKITPDATEGSTCSDREENLIEDPPKKMQKTFSGFNGFRKDLNNFKTVLAERNVEKKYTWLGNVVINQMEMINPEDQADAAWEVQCLMRKLTRQSSQKQSASTSSSGNDILELSMQGIFDDEDFD